MSRILIRHATIVNEGRTFVGSVVIEDERIAAITPDDSPTTATCQAADTIVDATGMLLLPGVIDEHVHFREPGMTHKATIASESRKAVMGGVTSFMDMPNCIPPTTTVDLVEAKHRIAEGCSPANWSFYLGATKDNITEIEHLDPQANCGIKVFMGSSTGGMLLDDASALRAVFSSTPLPIALHCEDQDLIAANIARYTAEATSGDTVHDLDISYHPLIRSAEACYRSSARAVELALQTGANIHILHISTARELSLFQRGPVTDKQITAEVCIPHLLYTDADYATLGAAIKCNPSIKTESDRSALRSALHDGLIDTVGTDHAPHTAADKQGGALRAASGIATLPYSLTTMLSLADAGCFTITDVVRTMCHNPALRYNIARRGFIRKGYQADLVLLEKAVTPTLSNTSPLPTSSKSSPQNASSWKVNRTWVNGYEAYAEGIVNPSARGQRLIFDRH